MRPGMIWLTRIFDGRELERQRLRQRRHRRAQHGRQPEVRDRLLDRRRGRHQDRAAAARGHRRHRRPHHAQRAEQQQVRPRPATPHRRTTAPRRPAVRRRWRTADRRRRTCSVVASAQRWMPVGRSHVQRQWPARWPGRGARARRADRRFVARRDRDERAFARERLRDREAEPAARARDHRHFALQSEIHAPPSLGLYRASRAGHPDSDRAMCHAPVRVDPRHHAIERLARRRVERGRRAPASPGWPARRGGAALPCGSPCRCLPGTRSASAARRGRTRRPPRPRWPARNSADDPHEDLRETRSRSSRRSRRPAALRAGTRRRARRRSDTSTPPICRLRRMRDVLNGVGGSSSLIVRARGISLAIRASSARLHRVAGDRRIVLDDDLDVDRVGERLVVAHDRVGVELRHARRADHHGRRAGCLARAGCSRCRSACPRRWCRRRRRSGRPTCAVTTSSTRRRSRSSSRATSPVTPERGHAVRRRRR